MMKAAGVLPDMVMMFGQINEPPGSRRLGLIVGGKCMTIG
jgi:F0F1-type ATP synthase beta subunit